MPADFCRIIVEDFLKSSSPCVKAIVREIEPSKSRRTAETPLYYFKDGKRIGITLGGRKLYLRASVEYSNPQLTVEEVQGIVAARLLECCGNYYYKYGLRQFNSKDINEICEMLKKPSEGPIVPFLLNTDEIEPDRYSMNPLKESIVKSGQSAFPVCNVRVEQLQIDQKFVEKYKGSLITESEVERISRALECCNGSYIEMVDTVKYEHLEILSKSFGIDLCLYLMQMPLTVLKKESPEGLLHQIIKETHKDYESIKCFYKCMGRSLKKRTTLLTVPHSSKGYASKRTARGKIYFEGTKLKEVKVKYRTTLLYENGVDPSDISIAKANDNFTVEANKLEDYSFKETASSPQFFLYSLASPENAVLWHGIGVFGASELLKSYTTTRLACGKDLLIKGLQEKYGISTRLPVQFNLEPKHMWIHPIHRNIDASIGCIKNLEDLASFGMKVEHLPNDKYIRDLD